MSVLLEQAIVDASALKSAAIKNAESAIIEKYAPDIKKAVESLLEQDEFGLEEPLEDEEEELGSDAIDNLPFGGDAPSEETEFVVSFEDLKDMAERLAGDQSEGEADLTGSPLPHQTVADAAFSDETGEPASVGMAVSLEEEIDIEDIDELLEELIVDINPQKEGWSAMTPDDIMDFKSQLKLASLAATKAQEEHQEIKQAAERLAEERKTLLGKNKKLLSAFRSLKEKFEQVNLSNARLIYTNRVLTNNSLNERQKSKIVESLSHADSIEEAKVIFETLQSAVGSVHNRKQPQSLREAIQRQSGTSLRREPRHADSPEVTRMQTLAGIKSK
jgi:hypothetical protein